MSESRVFTIPPGAPFLPTLADALISGRLVGDLGTDPFALAAVTLYLPTRRTVRAFTAVLSERLGGPALLPRMIPLGETHEAELDLAASPLLESERDQLAPPLPQLERRLILARLVRSWAQAVDRTLLPIDDEVPFLVPSSPADAIGLAADLERLMDALTVEGLPWEEIGTAVEQEHSRYFGLTIDFLRIAAENWPRILHERGASDPVARSRLLVLAEGERLRDTPPADPVIVAGSTGSVPATARLIAAVAALPRGAVVLPGLDHDLDAAGWDAIETAEGETREIAHGHPQAILHRLLGPGGLGLDRTAIEPLGAPDPDARARGAMLSQALRPAETTDSWARLDPADRERLASRGMAGIAVAETTDEREEALVIALALRETLETPGATAALITPDRDLAMRVSAELARWGIVAEDSAGISLARSPAGRLARLAAELAAGVTPATLISLLAHPLVRLGLPRNEVVRGAAALEIGALRGKAPGPGFAGMKAAVDEQRAASDRVARAKGRLRPVDWDLAAALLDALETAFAEFHCRSGDEDCDLVGLAVRHRATVDRLIRGPDEADGTPTEAADDPSLDSLDALFDDLALADPGALPGRFDDYPAFFAALAGERTVACGVAGPHPRLRILGLLESRLLSADRVVLGALDEGVWPMRTTTDAFLNRPMRERIGLNPPERRIGQSAHDFVEGLGCRDAVITRAAKREGSPTVPSRFLQRLRAFVGQDVWRAATARGETLRGHAAALDRSREAAPPRPSRPRPRPDPKYFPRKLSVTEIETLVRDPYSIFARHVLKLDPLDPVAVPPGPSERGTLIHDILGSFAQEHPEALPEEAAPLLGAIARDRFARLEAEYPEIHAEWFPRYERMAAAFLDWEAQRRAGLATVHPEIGGRWTIPLGREEFVLTARADRIEARRDGGFCIVDFKTGAPPSHKEVFAGFSPQLTLEAAMLMGRGFKGFRAAEVPDLVYVHASGGREPFREAMLKPPRGDERTVAGIVEEHVARLRGLVARYLAGEAAYPSRPYPKYARDYGSYDHLARVLEWSLGGEGEG